jgi:hypothetical protein
MPTATHDSIVTNYKALVETLTSPPPVVVRSTFARLEGDPLPRIVLVAGDERPGQYHFGCQDHEYEVLGQVEYGQDQVLTSGVGDARGWRQAIRDRTMPDPAAANPTPILPGVTAVWDVDFFELPADDQAAKDAGYEIARFGVLYKANEAIHA